MVEEQAIGEHILDTKICLRKLLVDQALDLIDPALPLLTVRKWCRVEESAVGHYPKRMFTAVWPLGSWVWLAVLAGGSRYSAINIWSKLVRYL